ncbi:hypothetical protein B7P43_G03415 [Cryptotermes secundus]|uniref:TIR domain-containing protein n=2 Tax=Cryptotermes secundus TaxID=105785 RepID=A0A2J7QS95_9NEOP|nr:hypothetical protein B7P43_G03415 [Cryptotermes secundus]
MDNCTYQWPEVSCTVIVKAEFHTTEDSKEYFRLLLMFRVVDPNLDESTNSTASTDRNAVLTNGTTATRQLLALNRADVTLVKSYEPQEGTVVVWQVSLPVILVLSRMRQIRLEASFSSSRPTASAMLDEYCNERPCTTSVEISTQTSISVNGKADICTEEFWTPLRTLIRRRLNGRIRTLHLAHAPGESANISKMLHNLNDFGIEDLMIVGVHWPRVQKKHLRQMSDLKVVNLSGSGISSIDNDTFDSTPNIERLVLSKNRLEYLPNSISSLRKLKMLDLSRNPQLHVEHTVNILKNVNNLRWLNLSQVPLKTLEPLRHIIHYTNSTEHNATTVQLSGIDLSGCDLTITAGDVVFFDFMASLLHINLSHNHLSTLPYNIFRSLHNLESLNLASNILINGFRLQIGVKQTLKLLDLSNNKLSNLESIYLSGTVEEINLSENAVLEWNKKDVFLKADDHNRTWVKSVNLTRNAITTITENMVISLLHLESVDLGENPFDCDSCETPTFQRWLSQHKSTKVFNLGTTNNLICVGTRWERTEIISVPFNNTFCLPAVENAIFDPAVVIGLPVLVVAALVLLSVITVYGYRFEIAYVRHLVSIRRQRHIRENESIAHYKYDVFVSYCVADRDWVIDELQPELEDGPEKYRLCLHERDFALGSIIANNIVESMKDSRTTLVVLSPHFVRSQWCRWELEVANHKLFEDDREFLVLVELKKLDRKAVPPHLSYLLDTRTYLEWPETSGPHPLAWRRLKCALGESLYQRRKRDGPSERNIELTSSCD